MLNTPVALIVFNRPSKTKMVFQEIAKAKPSKLFIIADGPRPDHSEDTEKCAEVREIVDHVDWECEVYKNYSESNMGCGVRPATGISWIFEHVEKAIILEDDCVPMPTFFQFCEELLEKYSDDERVMMISGRNSLFGQRQTPYSYSFRRIMSCWGWATWRRAWKYYDINIKLWPLLREKTWLSDILDDQEAIEYWKSIFDQTHSGKLDVWDYQWLFTYWAQNGLGVAPNTNLVRNIGFGENSTHTKNKNSKNAKVMAADIVFPLQHPPYVIRDREDDLLLINNIIMPKKRKRINLYRRILRKITHNMRWLRDILIKTKDDMI